MNARVFLFITLIYFAAFFAHGAYLKKTVYGDGVFYYSWLRSIVIDHDIDFKNEYKYFNVSQPMRPDGMPGNKYAIGPALFWAPAFITTHTLLKQTGYEFPYQIAVGFTNVALALIGLLLLYNLLKQWSNETISTMVVLSIALATHLLFYGSIDPVNTHALTFFAAAFYLTLLFETKPRWFLIGAALGIIALLRPQDLVYGILLFGHPGLGAGIQNFKTGFRVKPGMTLLIGFLLAFLPQLAAWQALYGSFLVTPYYIEGQTFNFFQPKMLEVLFSATNGLFLWTPILVLGFFGLIKTSFWFIQNQTSSFSRWMLLTMLIHIYVVASWKFWWQGAAYSGRMFVSILPLFAFGLAHLFSSFKKKSILPAYITLSFSALNLGFIVFFLTSF